MLVRVQYNELDVKESNPGLCESAVSETPWRRPKSVPHPMSLLQRDYSVVAVLYPVS